MNKLVLASANPGKLREFQKLLGNLGRDVRPQSEFAIVSPAETGLTFVENAIIKARYACEQSGLPAIADDSGIEVDALDGAPGIYSARYAGSECDDKANNRKLLNALTGLGSEKRSARYQCILVYLRHAHDPTPLIAQGSWEGTILDAPVGEHGFGYDPIFWVPSHGCSSAQLDPDEKNRISHRAIAMQKLVEMMEQAA